MEEVGEVYINESMRRPFFQQSIHSESHFRMDDLSNDLAQYVAGNFFG